MDLDSEVAGWRYLHYDGKETMSFLDPDIPFDPEKPFHRLVVAYAAQVHGLLDLSARGIRIEWKKKIRDAIPGANTAEEALVEKLCDGVEDGYSDYVRGILATESSPILGVQRLGTQCGNGVKVETDALAQEILAHHRASISSFSVMSAGSMLILSWESTMEQHTRHPLWEFLRHCRNASAHNEGRFSFRNEEPRRPARWRDLEIVSSLQGTPLFPDLQQQGFFGPGDALHLLADIEREFY